MLRFGPTYKLTMLENISINIFAQEGGNKPDPFTLGTSLKNLSIGLPNFSFPLQTSASASFTNLNQTSIKPQSTTTASTTTAAPCQGGVPPDGTRLTCCVW